MSTVYTSRQMRFVHVFTRHIQPLLKSFLKIESSEQHDTTSSDNTLDNLATGVNTLSAAAAFVGIAAAAPTLGTSVVGASACIVLLQTIDGCSKFVRRHIDNKDEPFSPDETKQDEMLLSLTILLRQIAFTAAVRYRHFIDEIIDEHSINTFAIFVAERAMKKLRADLAEQTDLSTPLNPDIFLDYYMTSAKLSVTKKSTTLALKKPYSNPNQCSPTAAYAKLACSRPGLAVHDAQAPGQYTLYVSPSIRLFRPGNTTLEQQYGFATVPPSELNAQTAAVTRQNLRPLNPDAMQEALNKYKSCFSVYYSVSRHEVSEYLTSIRKAIPTNQPVKSLNQYLSERFNTHVIATCDDARLRGLDLSSGNFSEAWFVGHTDLTDCNLQNTTWTYAHLNGARFERNDLTGVNFQHAYAEKSIWRQINFLGDFSHTKLNGSKLIDCTISVMFNQFGCEWELVELENVKQEDAMQLLNLRFDEQLTREHRERIQFNHEINTLKQHYERCIQQIIKTHDLTLREEEILELLHERIQSLENKYAQHLIQLDFRLEDIKTQLLRRQNDQNKREEKQQAVIETLSRRVDQLEHKPPVISMPYLAGQAFFRANHGKQDDVSSFYSKTQ